MFTLRRPATVFASDYLRVMMKLLHEVLPASSHARMTIVLSPTRSAKSGIDQEVVPFAVPDRSPDAVHVMDLIPPLSAAVPVIRTTDADVDEIASRGEVMERDGAVRSLVGVSTFDGAVT